MKNLLYTSLLVVTLGLSQNAKAQITLEHTFDGSVHIGNYLHENLFQGINYYVLQDDETNQVNLYAEDFSLYKTITLTPPAGYRVRWGQFFSKNVFSTDGKIAFWFSFENETALDFNSRVIARIYDEDGTIVKDFGASNWKGNIFFHVTSNNQLRMSIVREFRNEETSQMYSKTEIYSLPGTIPTWHDDVSALDERVSVLEDDMAGALLVLQTENEALLDSLTWLRDLLAECEGSKAPNAETLHIAPLQVYPNPANYELRIMNYEWKPGDIVELFDMTGKRVYSAPFGSAQGAGTRSLSPSTSLRINSIETTVTIDISHLPEGTYVVRIGGYVAKIVKQ